MTKMAAVLSEVSKAMNRMSSSAYLSVKELLVSAAWKYSHDRSQQKHLREPTPVMLEGEQNYSECFNISGTQLMSKATIMYIVTHLCK